MHEMEKSIIDVTCGSRSIWFDKNEPHTVYCDKRCEEYESVYGSTPSRITIVVKPDVIADFTNLPFPDSTFSLAVFDPPHLVDASENAWLTKRYGKLQDGWQSMLKQGFNECMRVLKPNGVLIFKWSEIQIKSSEIWKIFGQTPLFGHRSGRKMNTHWAVFMKFDDLPMPEPPEKE